MESRKMVQMNLLAGQGRQEAVENGRLDSVEKGRWDELGEWD